MARKKRKRKAKSSRRWPALRALLTGHAMRFMLAALVTAAALGSSAYGIARLDDHVDRLVNRHTEMRIEFVEMPRALRGRADTVMVERMEPVLDGSWTDPALCERAAAAISDVGWVSAVRWIRRGGDGVLRVYCSYRLPYALINAGGTFYAVDRTGVRVPGEYGYDASFVLLDGIHGSPPAEGALWPGEDVQAALRLAEVIRDEPYARQITGIVVSNFAGRLNPNQSHVSLATDRAGGRVHWGSAPGREIEENSVHEKLEILRANFSRSGRVDAGHTVIDVSTFPDRYTIPR